MAGHRAPGAEQGLSLLPRYSDDFSVSCAQLVAAPLAAPSVDSPDGRCAVWTTMRTAGKGHEARVRARSAFGVLRLATAAVCTVALVHRLFWGLSSRSIAGENFFAYLTVQSNCALVVVLLIGAVLAFIRATDPRWFTVALALVLTWTITAGLAFALIVWQAGLRGIRVDVPWSDQVLHFWRGLFGFRVNASSAR